LCAKRLSQKRKFNGRGELVYEIGESEVVKMFTAIAFWSLLVCVVSFIFAKKGIKQLYWISAVGIYIFSFITGFTIGYFTVGLTFVFLSLAIGYSLGRIKGKSDYSLFAGVGIITGFLMVVYVGSGVFLPFWKLLPSSFLNYG
jgi:hypothetical protein